MKISPTSSYSDNPPRRPPCHNVSISIFTGEADSFKQPWAGGPRHGGALSFHSRRHMFPWTRTLPGDPDPWADSQSGAKRLPGDNRGEVREEVVDVAASRIFCCERRVHSKSP